jgi:BON domain
MTNSTHLSDYDAELAKRIGIALNSQNRESLKQLKYETIHGIVTLRGKVHSQFEGCLAVTLIGHVAGVRRVVSQLELLTPHVNCQPEPVVINPAWKKRRVLVMTATIAILFVTGWLLGRNSRNNTGLQPLAGQITWSGKPLANALVVFHPKHAERNQRIAARATTDSLGQFQVTTHRQHDGISPGEYVVTVVHHPLISDEQGTAPGPNVLAPQLSSPATSDILFHVAAGQDAHFPIEVQR